MKKAFIGLLLLAAGTAIYILLQKRNKPIIQTSIHKEQIIGKWKLDTIQYPGDSSGNKKPEFITQIDSSMKQYQIEFMKNGFVGIWHNDSLLQQNTGYEWTKEDELAWNNFPANKTKEIFNVLLLNNDSLTLLSKNGITQVFTKAE